VAKLFNELERTQSRLAALAFAGASSPEFVGEFWLGKGSKSVI
jgi:hypothetical protein